MMLGLVELLLEIFVVSQMSQLGLLGQWPCLSDPILVPPRRAPVVAVQVSRVSSGKQDPYQVSWE